MGCNRVTLDYKVLTVIVNLNNYQSMLVNEKNIYDNKKHEMLEQDNGGAMTIMGVNYMAIIIVDPLLLKILKP